MLLMVVREDGLGEGRWLRFLYRRGMPILLAGITNLFPTIVQTASSQHPLSRIHPLWSDFILSRGHHATSHCTDTGVLEGVRQADQWQPPESHQSAPQAGGAWHDFEGEDGRCGAISLRSAGTGESHDWSDARAWQPSCFSREHLAMASSTHGS